MNFNKEFLDSLKNMSMEELRTQYSDITQMDGRALTLARGLTNDQIRDEILDYMDSPSYLTQEEEEFSGMGRADVIQSILLHQEDDADSAGVNTLGYTRSELNTLNDEDLESIINDYVKNPSVEWEDNKDLEIPTYSSTEDADEDLTSDEGEKLSKFSGMGKGRHGRNRIHEEKPADDYEECDVCGYDHEYDFPHLSDETKKKIEKLHNKTNEVAPPGVKPPWATAWSKYNKDELKENNKITIGQLRQIIREELLKVKK